MKKLTISIALVAGIMSAKAQDTTCTYFTGKRVVEFNYYTSKILSSASLIHATTENEFLAIVYALDNFISYLLGSELIVFTAHVALRSLIERKDSKSDLMCWVLLLRKFSYTIKDRKGCDNMVANHLSHLEKPSDNIDDIESFPGEYLFNITTHSSLPWYTNIFNYLVVGNMPES